MNQPSEAPSADAVRAALARIVDPHTGLDLVASHAVRGVGVDAGKVAIELQLGYPAAGWHEALAAEVRAWLAAHPERTFVFHFLPVHASWLSFIEVWFSILSKKCLRRASFSDATIATQEIEAFMRTYNLHMAHPFAWKKGVRFYKRLKAKIAARQALPLAA